LRPLASTLPDIFEIKSEFIREILRAAHKSVPAVKAHGKDTVTNSVIDAECKCVTDKQKVRRNEFHVSKISRSQEEREVRKTFRTTAGLKYLPRQHEQQQEEQKQEQQRQQQRQQQQHGQPQQQQMSVFPFSKTSHCLPSGMNIGLEMEQQCQRHPLVFLHTHQNLCSGGEHPPPFGQTNQEYDLNVGAFMLSPAAMSNDQQLQEHHVTQIKNHEAWYPASVGAKRRQYGEKQEHLRENYQPVDGYSQESNAEHRQPYLRRQFQQHEQEQGWSMSCWPPSTPWQRVQSRPMQQGEHRQSLSAIPHSKSRLGTGLFLLSMAAAQSNCDV
jgi:hypothetical protein